MWFVFLAACPACTRLGLQKDIDEINARLETVDADIKKFDGLKKLKPALLELNLKIRNTRVCNFFSYSSVKAPCLFEACALRLAIMFSALAHRFPCWKNQEKQLWLF